jgi:DHA3 family tetracycline resistance protein-like MFS transporter
MRSRSAASLYLFLIGASSLFSAMVYTVELIYQAITIGLNPLQLVLAGTMQQVVSILFQAPTGALADVYSRRLAVVTGLVLIGSAYLLEGLIPSFFAVLAAQAVLGVGGSLRDGADAAWIADELGAEQAGPVYLRATQLGWLATLPGIAVGAIVGSVHLNLPVVIGGAMFLVLAVVLALIMPERSFRPSQETSRPSPREMARTIGAGARLLRAQPALRTIMVTAVMVALYGAGFHRLWQYHILHHLAFPSLGSFAPIVWFGGIEAVISLTSAFGIELVLRRIDTNSHGSVGFALSISTGITLLGTLVFAVTGQFAVALAGLWLVTSAFGPHNPLEQAWMNQNLESSVRATVFSVHNLVQDLAGIVGGPILGVIATTYSTSLAIGIAGLFLTPAMLLYARSAATVPEDARMEVEITHD